MSSTDIAIIGFSGKFPQANSVDEFWSNLKNKIDCVSAIPESRFDNEGFVRASNKEKKYGFAKMAGLMRDIKAFDSEFFKIIPREAKYIDPQQRLMLESVWVAIESSNCLLKSLQEIETGVFFGASNSDYHRQVLNDHDAINSGSLTGVCNAIIANRVSFFYDFTGPSITVDTACSSSLVAVDLAITKLLSGDIDAAVAGGVSTISAVEGFLCGDATSILSPEGRCKVFDDSASGYVRGEGVGVVILKKLDRAVADGDTIHAIIKSSATNQDGLSNGLSAPNPLQQQKLIEKALKKANLNAADVGFLESHGTGTPLGDPMEIKAIQATYSDTCRSQPLYVGALKSNIGHLEAAAGIAGLIKVIHVLKHNYIPPNLHLQKLNKSIKIDKQSLDLVFPTEGIELSNHSFILNNAAISSFGIGGTNCHMILGRAEQHNSLRKYSVKPYYLVSLSAKSKKALERKCSDLVEWLLKTNEKICDIAYTLNVFREHFKERRVYIVSSTNELADMLERSLNAVEIDQRANCNIKASEIISKLNVVDVNEYKQQLIQIGEIYKSYGFIDWQALHADESMIKVQLPSYPFDRKSYWITKATEKKVLSSPPQISTNPCSDKSEVTSPVANYYDSYVENDVDSSKGNEFFLTFAPFPKKLEGFSWLATFFNPKNNESHRILTLDKQKEMRQILMQNVNFSTVSSVLDIGCGHASDLISLAKNNSNIQILHGYTISTQQARVGSEKISNQKLNDRVTIYNRDSAQIDFPASYDLIYGYEVTFHIKNKAALFGNISRHLKENGFLVLADFTSNVRTALDNSQRGTYISTKEQWQEILSENNLQLVEVIDISPEITNFLYDPMFEKHSMNHDSGVEIIEDYHELYNNISTSLEKGLVSYFLMTCKKVDGYDVDNLKAFNLKKLNSAKLYCDVLYEKPSLVIDSQGIFKTAIRTKENIQKSQEFVEPLQKSLAQELMNIFIQELEFDEALDPNVPFNELGVDSITGVVLIDIINERWDLYLEPTIFFDYPTFSQFESYLLDEFPSKFYNKNDDIHLQNCITAVVSDLDINNESHRETDIAIIGMAGQFPDAKNPDDLWALLKKGHCAISEVPLYRWNAENFYSSATIKPDQSNSKWGGFLPEDLFFDSMFFHISPAEAKQMDPQQGLFLQTAWQAIESSGYSPENLQGVRCSVFVGVATSDQPAGTLTGNSNAILAARIAYHLNLNGASLAVDTACSSSLVAVHLGVQSLLSDEVDMVLAGGISMYNTPNLFIHASQLNMLSPSGRCSSMGVEADGMVLGEGVGVVVLKKLTKALHDGDHIFGVIKGSGVNQNGKTNGITAPSKDAQCKLQMDVYKKFNIDPGNISFIETQGTGTPLGDSIEVAALTQSFQEYTDKHQFCALGSLKPNIGHTSMAAGVVSLIKVLLQLQNKMLVPMINYKESSSLIHLENSPFYVNTECEPWEKQGSAARLCAINSFGFSGTNCHIVVSEYADKRVSLDITKPAYLVTFSAKDRANLLQKLVDMSEWLNNHNINDHDEEKLAAISYTMNYGRSDFEERIAVVVTSIGDLKSMMLDIVDGVNMERCFSQKSNLKSNNQLTQQNFLKFCVDQIINSDLSNKTKEFIEVLENIAQLYVDGYHVDWNAFYKNDPRRIISLPTYPFVQELESQQSGVTSVMENDQGQAATILHDKLSYAVMEILKIPAKYININRPFKEYGFDSISFVKFINFLESEYQIKITFSMLSEESSIFELTQALMFNDKKNTLIMPSLNNDLAELEHFDIGLLMKSTSIENILLTGASGFLGCHLLASLLQETSAHIYCLIRAKTKKQATKKLLVNLENYDLSQQVDWSRVTIVLGDLEKSKCGLSNKNYTALSSKVDIIVHNGARVSYLSRYSDLESANVSSCYELIKIATNTKLKKIHFISSVAVFSDKDYLDPGVVDEDCKPAYFNDILLGYGKTKFMAERIFEQARNYGLPVNIYRIDRIAGDSSTGICQQKDFLWNLIRVGLVVNAFPNIPIKVNLTPVNKVSYMVSDTIVNGGDASLNLHIRNPNDIDFVDLLKALKPSGYSFKVVSKEAWFDIVNNNKENLDEVLLAILPLLEHIDKFSDSLPIDNQRTLALFGEDFVRSLAVSEVMLQKYIDYFIRCDFFPETNCVEKER